MTESTTPFRSGFISIIGRPNVGKSTLLNRILGTKIAITANKPQTTRNRILGIHTMPGAQLLFIDTPGIHKAVGKLNRFMVDQALSACSGVDLILYVVEVKDRPGPGDDFILDVLRQSQLPVILLINKIDQLPKERQLELMAAYGERFPFREIVPVSGQSGENVDYLLKLLPRYLKEGPPYYAEDMITDLPERFIVAEMIREQVLKQTHEEIPYRVATLVERFEEKPEKNLVVIQAVIIVDRESHKGILVGKQGATIRAIGKAARIDIERLLDARVFLELFVKVQKNWTESERLLKEFGY
ncbi:GTPase Era [Trichloromonas sp.]|uniref:GTPase Era n=1 Tax=Trichloromonas sp. TaxID=3069249 RepID=UPI002A4B89A1|nr:GTPase Era [Trichloromonas sp.]